MAGLEIPNSLEGCPATARGCLASNTLVVFMMEHGDDPVVTADIQRAAAAALQAGAEGQSLEDTAYTRATAEVTGIGNPLALFGERLDVAYAHVGEGDERGVLEPGAERELDDIREQAVRCAYMCGKNITQCYFQNGHSSPEQ